MQITYTLFLTISDHDYWAILSSNCVTRIQELTHYITESNWSVEKVTYLR